MSLQDPVPAAPAIPTARELYDAIMRDIEPELLTKNLTTLRERYKNETSEQKAARLKRYNAAFAQYQNRYSDFILNLNRRVMEYKTTMRIVAERTVRNQENALMKQLETQILSS